MARKNNKQQTEKNPRAAGRPRGQSPIPNERQRWFCYAYMVHGNKRRAAEEAGYAIDTSPGYVDRLFKHAAVQAFLAELRAEREAEMEVDRERMMGMLWKRGSANPGLIHAKLAANDYDLSCLTFEESLLVAGWEVKEVYEGRGDKRQFAYNIIKVKLHDPETAWDKLNRMLGAYSETLNVNDNAAALLRAKVKKRREQRRKEAAGE